MASNLGTGENTASEFREKFFQTYKTLDNFTHTSKQESLRDGYVTTFLNRRRILRSSSGTSPQKMGQLERQALNTKIQGSAADIMRKALLKIDQEIEKRSLDASLVLQLHDELIFEVEKPRFRYIAKLVIKCMERCAQDLSVRMPVKVKAGEDWGSLQELEFPPSSQSSNSQNGSQGSQGSRSSHS